MNNTNVYRSNTYSKDSYNQASRDYKFINKQKRHRDEENSFKHNNSNENHQSYKSLNNYPNKNFGKSIHQKDKYSSFSNNKYYSKKGEDNRSHSRERKDYYSEKDHKKGRNYQDEHYDRKNNHSHIKDQISIDKPPSNFSMENSRSSSSRNYDEYHQKTSNFSEENDFSKIVSRKNNGSFSETSKDYPQSMDDYTSNHKGYSSNPSSKYYSSSKEGKYESSKSINPEGVNTKSNYDENAGDFIQSSLFPGRYSIKESKEALEQEEVNKNNFNYEFSNNNSNNFSKDNNKLNNNNINNSYEYTSKSLPFPKVPSTYSLQQNYINQKQSGFSSSSLENNYQNNNSRSYQHNFNQNKKPIYNPNKYNDNLNFNNSKNEYPQQENENPFNNIQSNNINNYPGKEYQSNSYLQPMKEKNQAINYNNQGVASLGIKLEINSEPTNKLEEDLCKKFYNQYNNQSGGYYNNTQNAANQIQKPAYYVSNANKPATNNYSNIPLNQTTQNPNIKKPVGYLNNTQNYSFYPQMTNSASSYPMQNQNQLNIGNNNHYNNKYFIKQAYQQIINGSMNQMNQPSKNIQINISLNNQYNKEISREVQKTLNSNLTPITNQVVDNNNFSNSGLIVNTKEVDIPGYNDILLETNLLTTLVTTKNNENKKNFSKLLKETLNDYVISRETNKFSEYFKSISFESSNPAENEVIKPESSCDMILSVPSYFIEESKTFSQDNTITDKEIRSLKSELGHLKKKKENENIEIKKQKGTTLKLDLSIQLLKLKQAEIRKNLDEILSEII